MRVKDSEKNVVHAKREKKKELSRKVVVVAILGVAVENREEAILRKTRSHIP